MKTNRNEVAWACILWACVIGLMWLMLGCTTTKYVDVPSYHTEYITKTDSFVFHDTITKTSILKERVRDTTWLDSINGMLRINHLREIESVKDAASNETIIKYIVLRDTINRTDSIRVPYPVEKELTKWEKAKMNVGGVVLGLLTIVIIIVIIYAVWWLIRSRKK